MKVLTNNQYYSQIANVIREQNGTNNTYTPPQMVNALKDLFCEEVEGVPPISFNGIGENLLDYRIDGASGGVGDKTSNLLQNTASSQTINGVTFTVNNDGSVICNGTSSAVTTFAISIKLNSNINYVLSGSPKNGGIETYRLDLRNISYSVYNNTADNGDGINFTIEENGTYLVCIRIADNYTCNNLTFYPMIRLASIQDDAYEPYGYKVPVVISGKNLLNFNEWSENLTVNANNELIISNNSVTITAVENDAFTMPYYVNHPNVYKMDVLPNSQYILSWVSNNTLSGRIFIFKNGLTGSGNQINVNNAIRKYITFSTDENTTFITIRFGVTNAGDSITFSNIQLEKGSIATDYEPYHEPTTTNIYIDEPIEENESISLSDTNTNIPTIRGTNVLTVDTAVQPSNVYVKSRKESQYETAMREDYEEQLSDIESALQEV